jgi:hypothetical protein
MRTPVGGGAAIGAALLLSRCMSNQEDIRGTAIREEE